MYVQCIEYESQSLTASLIKFSAHEFKILYSNTFQIKPNPTKSCQIFYFHCQSFFRRKKNFFFPWTEKRILCSNLFHRLHMYQLLYYVSIIFSLFLIIWWRLLIKIQWDREKKNGCNRLLQLTKSEHLIKLNKNNKWLINSSRKRLIFA